MQIYFCNEENKLKKTYKPIHFDNTSLKKIFLAVIAKLYNCGKKNRTYYLIFSQKEQRDINRTAKYVFEKTGLIGHPSAVCLAKEALDVVLRDLQLEPRPKIIEFSTLADLTTERPKDLGMTKKMRIGLKLS